MSWKDCLVGTVNQLEYVQFQNWFFSTDFLFSPYFVHICFGQLTCRSKVPLVQLGFLLVDLLPNSWAPWYLALEWLSRKGKVM